MGIFAFIFLLVVPFLAVGQIGCGSTSGDSAPSDAGGDVPFYFHDAGPDSALPTSTGPIAQISAGGSFACALGKNGYVWCWGSNQAAELGADEAVIADFGPHSTPTRVQGLSDVVRISAGYLMACAVKSDGTVWCWGANDFGQLGHAPTELTCSYDFGTLQCTPEPVQVPGITGAIGVSAGRSHACALVTTAAGKTIECWGDNGDGQLGRTPVAFMVPVAPGRADGIGDDVEQISASESDDTCVRKTDGSLWCWGANEFGALGHDPALDSQTCTFGACTRSPEESPPTPTAAHSTSPISTLP